MLKVILSSQNKSKKESVEKVFAELNIEEYEINCVSVNSNVSSKPLNEEILYGAKNRNKALLNYCHEQNIEYDLLVSIEGGYEQVGNNYFVVSYACIYDAKKDVESVGISPGLAITEEMFYWVKAGKPLNRLVEKINESTDNKKSSGISGYLTSGYYYRSNFDSMAIMSAMQYIENLEKYQTLSRKMKEYH